MAPRIKVAPLPEDLLSAYLVMTANVVGRFHENEERQDIASPFLDEPFAHVYVGDEEVVDFAFGRARQAQQRWAETPIKTRQQIFRDFHDRVLKNRELLVDIVQMETGKNRLSALDEVLDVVSNARFYANAAPRLLKEKPMPGAIPGLTRSKLQRTPKGVVGQISPWNYPLALGISDAIPALLAGNAVVAKPDSQTPFSLLSVLRLLYESGLPRDLMQVVTGSGRVVGSAIANNCDYLMFTGSTATGRVLGKTAGERLIGFSAELGGKNPLLISADADLDRSIREAISACFSNSGQLCVSIERIYVEEAVYDEFVSRFGTAVNNMRLASGFDWDADMGSLINADQLETVETFVETAKEKGARVLAGGRTRPELGRFFYEPTVLVDVPNDADLYCDEVFGPVVFIEKVANLDEAIAKANDTSYGLNAAVFAESETGWKAAGKLLAGGVGINDGYTATWATVASPLGGMKDSGVARRHGDEGMLKYTEPRNIAEQRGISMRGPASLPRKTYGTLMANAMLWGKKLKFLP